MKSTVIVIGLLLASLKVMASNPADVTGDYLLIPVPFYKATAEGNSWSGFISEPLNKNISASLFNFHDEGYFENELTLSVKLNTQCQMALIGNYHNEASETNEKKSLLFDFTNGRYGVGTITSVEDGKTRLGLRAQTKDFTVFVSLKDGEKPLKGITYHKNGVQVDFAFDNGSSWFRASKVCGNVIPELRLQFRTNESVIGFGLGFCPN